MGKGKGRGQGKGGCECCEAIHALACCLCLVLFGGPILIAVGATLIATGNRNDRARTIDAVQAAVDAWNDPANPNGWQQFQRATLFAHLAPSLTSVCGSPTDKQLVPDTASSDVYFDEQRRFGSVRQLKLSAYTDFVTFLNCNTAVNLTQQLAAGSGNTSLLYLPFTVPPRLNYGIQIDKAGGPRDRCATRNDGCGTSNYRNCRSNCENYFYGRFDCNGGNYQCSLSQAYYDNFAIKVSYVSNNASRPAGYYMDTAKPGEGGGANVLPAGFLRQYDPSSVLPRAVPTGPRFQLPSVPRLPPSGPPPAKFGLTVRSSADPWLTYMALTDGSGYFGVSKSALMAAGVTMVVVGCVGSLMWAVAAFYGWWLLCSRRRPTSRPAGVNGYAWDLANRYGGPYAPALGVPVLATGQDGMPTAQPMYVPPGSYPAHQVQGQPVPGYPPYSPYPQPYGAPQPVPYPPYPYPAPHPPPHGGGNVEMNQFHNSGAAHPQPYGYPPLPDGQATYAYQYPYPYPPYGGAPPPPPGGGGAPATSPDTTTTART